MNPWPFHRSEPRVQVRYVAATKRENKKASRKQEETTAQLQRFVDERLLNAVADGLGVRL